MITYFIVTNKKYPTLSNDGLKEVQWYVNASFVAHPDFKSHTG